MAIEQTHYDTLHIEPTADAQAISRAYRQLAKRFHPDRDPSPQARGTIVAINRAYDVLKHPARRTDYDAQLRPDRTAWLPVHGAAPPRDESGAPRESTPPAPPAAFDPGPILRRHAPSGRASTVPGGPEGGIVLDFGRYAGWTLRAIAATDPDYLEWLARSSGGRRYAAGIAVLRDAGALRSSESPRVAPTPHPRHGSLWHRSR